MRRLLWPSAGLALLALGWWLSGHGAGWGAFYAALVTGAFAEAARIERSNIAIPGQIWLFSRRNAILGAVPFALFGAWTAALDPAIVPLNMDDPRLAAAARRDAHVRAFLFWSRMPLVVADGERAYLPRGILPRCTTSRGG